MTGKSCAKGATCRTMRSGKKRKGPLQCDYITCQMDMDIGVAHNEAMDKCLRKYHFKSLPCVNPEANKWQRKHAMDCIVWAHNIVGDSPSSQATTMLAVQESSMPEEELHNILKVSLIDEEVDETAQAGCSREQSGFHLTQTSLESDVDAIEHLHVSISQNQRNKSILSSSLECFLINKSTVFLSCSNHLHRQLISHGT